MTTRIKMYREFFGLKEHPFNVTSDPNFLFLSRVHKEAFSHLLYGIKERTGFLEIPGEVGAGTTTLCRAILNQFDSNTKSAFIFNSKLPDLELLQSILEDFGLEPGQKSKSAMLRQLNNCLLEELSKGNNVILVVDEAQNLTPHEVKTIVTRVGDGTKIVLTGDPYQIDNPYVDQTNNGLVHVVNRFKNEKLAAHVTMSKGERSPLAELAANLL